MTEIAVESSNEIPQLDIDQLQTTIGQLGPNIDQYIKTNIVCAQVLRMTARPAVKTNKSKPSKKKPKGKTTTRKKKKS